MTPQPRGKRQRRERDGIKRWEPWARRRTKSAAATVLSMCCARCVLALLCHTRRNNVRAFISGWSALERFNDRQNSVACEAEACIFNTNHIVCTCDCKNIKICVTATAPPMEFCFESMDSETRRVTGRGASGRMLQIFCGGMAKMSKIDLPAVEMRRALWMCSISSSTCWPHAAEYRWRCTKSVGQHTVWPLSLSCRRAAAPLWTHCVSERLHYRFVPLEP